MNGRYRFSPALRLLRPAEFQAVFDGAAFKVGESQFLFLVRPNGLDHPRLGLVIAKKKIRHAVDRNRVKRTVRESFRLHQAALPAADVIFLVRQDLATLPAGSLRSALDQAWKKISRKAERTGPGNPVSGAEA